MNYAIKDAGDVTLIEKESGTQALFTEYANSTSLEFSADRIFATAGGVNKVAFDTGKSGTFGLEMEVFEFKWISIMLGATVTTGNHEVFGREVLTVSGGEVTLAKAPVAGSVGVFTLEADKISHKAECEVTVSSTTVTITSGATDGDTVVVYYMKTTTGTNKYTVTADSVTKNYTLFCDTEMTNEVGGSKVIQLKLPNIKPVGNFSVSFSSTSVANLSVSFDILADSDGTMLEFIELDEE